MIKKLLQKITKNNSENIVELFESFSELYPQEEGLINLLRDYVYSETPLEIKGTDDPLIQRLTDLI